MQTIKNDTIPELELEVHIPTLQVGVKASCRIACYRNKKPINFHKINVYRRKLLGISYDFHSHHNKINTVKYAMTICVCLNKILSFIMHTLNLKRIAAEPLKHLDFLTSTMHKTCKC